MMCLPIGDVAPVEPSIIGAPEAAAGIAGEPNQRLSGDAGDRDTAAAARWADVAPSQSGMVAQSRIRLRGGRGGPSLCAGERGAEEKQESGECAAHAMGLW